MSTFTEDDVNAMHSLALIGDTYGGGTLIAAFLFECLFYPKFNLSLWQNQHVAPLKQNGRQATERISESKTKNRIGRRIVGPLAQRTVRPMATAKSSAEAILSRVRENADAVLVSYSGGKDSIVVLDLAVKMFPRVECFFMYLVRDLEHLRPVLEWPEKRYGIAVRQYPHFSLSRMIGEGVFRPSRDPDMPKVGPNEIYALARKDSGIEWVLSGMRQTDSVFRRWQMRAGGVVNESRRVACPLAEWNEKDVRAYIKLNRLIQPVRYATGNMDGVSTRHETLKVIRERFPADYERIKSLFPLVELQFEREKIYGGK